MTKTTQTTTTTAKTSKDRVDEADVFQLPAPWERALTKDELMANGTRFDAQLRATGRDGVEGLLEWLHTTDFFRAPLQPQVHGAFMGGLCAHTLVVADTVVDLAARWRPEIDPASARLVGLLHDLWKADAFHPVERRRRDGNRWVSVMGFEFRTDSPQLGHHEKSVIYAQRFLRLTDDEALAIRWAAGAFDDAAYTYAGRAQLNSAMNQCPLLVLLNAAVTLATNLVATPVPEKVLK